MSETVDITGDMFSANTPPQEAANLITKAQLVDVPPTEYRDAQEQFQEQIDKNIAPKEASYTVAQYAAQSDIHASLIKNDISTLSRAEFNFRNVASEVKAEKSSFNPLEGVDLTFKNIQYDDTLAKYFQRGKEEISNRGTARRIGELYWKMRVSGGKLNNADQMALAKLQASLPEGEEDDFFRDLPFTVLGSAYDMYRGVIENPTAPLIGAGLGAVQVTGSALTGLGVVPGLLTAARTVGTGIMVATTKDTYIQTTNSTYQALTEGVDEKTGKPLNLPESEKNTISSGVGVMVAAIDHIGSMAALQKVPLFKKLLSKKGIVNLVTDPLFGKLRTTFTKLGKIVDKSPLISATATEGFTEGIQEIIQIIGGELGKTWDGKETSLTSALNNSLTPSNLKRVGEAGVAGGVAGGAFNLAGRAITAPVNRALEKGTEKAKKKQAERKAANPPPIIAPAPVVPEGVPTTPKGTIDLNVELAKAETFKKAWVDLSDELGKTEINKLAPDELNKIRSQMLKDSDHVWIDSGTVRRYVEANPNVGRVIEETIGRPIDSLEDGEQIQIPPDKFLNIVDADRGAAGLAKSGPEKISAVAVNKMIEDAKVKREKILAEKGAPTPPKIDLEKIIGPHDIKEGPITEEEYANPPKISEAVASVMSDEEKKRLNISQVDVQNKVIEGINEAAHKERDAVVDVNKELALGVEREILATEVINDPKVKIVEKFLNAATLDITGDGAIKSHPLAINPSAMSPELQKQYRGNKKLKDRGVFSKEGMTPEAVARHMGVENSNELLDILANSPSADEAIDQAVTLREAAISAKVEASVDFNETAKAKMLNDRTGNHIKEMKLLLDAYWRDVKGAIKRIALPLPTVQELRQKATNIVNNLKIRQLNETQFKMAEVASQKKAINSILKNEVEQAFAHKENAALNSELTRATTKAIRQTNKDIRFISTILTEHNQTILTKAGAKYIGAVREALAAFNFAPKRGEEIKQGAYQSLVKNLIDSGQGDISIPQSVIESIDTRGSVNDLTPLQLRVLADSLRTVLKKAKEVHETITNYEEGMRLHKESVIAATLHDAALSRPEYDPERGGSPQGTGKEKNKIGKWLAKSESLVAPINYIVLQLDGGVHGGVWAKMLYHALRGAGIHEGIYGESAAKKLGLEVREAYKKEIAAYGEKEFNNNAVKEVYVSEFKDIKSLSYGNLTKLDLLMMAKHWGNLENRERLTNFGIDEITLGEILEKHLTKKDMDFIQKAIWNIHESFKPKIIALEQATMGTVPEFVEAAPFTMFGTEYKGGYAPLHYASDIDSKEIRHQAIRKIDSISGDMETEFRPSYAAQGMTKRNYLKDRTGSKKQISLNPVMTVLGFEEVIHDLTMRVPIMDTFKLLKNSSVSKDIIALVGPDKYNILLNTTMEATNSADMDRMRLFAAEHDFIRKTLSKIDSANAVNLLAGNVQSILMQPMSMLTAWEAMGTVSGAKYLTLTLEKIFNPLNQHKLGDIYKFATEINPDIKSYTEGLDDHSFGGLKDLQPKERWFKSESYNALKQFQEKANEILMGKILGFPDVMQKIVIATAAYSQFMAGEAKGHSLDSVMAMSEDMREAQAKGYAQHISTTTLTTSSNIDKAVIQKNAVGQLFSKFWNDPRNQLNNALQVNRNMANSIREAKMKLKDGDIMGATEAYQDVGSKLLTALMLATTAALFRKIIRNEDDSPLKESGPFLGNVAMHYLASPLHFPEERFGLNAPVARDVIYAARGKWNKVSIPLIGVLSNTATALEGVGDALNIMDSRESMDEKEFKALMGLTGIFAGGLPVSGAFKAYDNLDSIGNAAAGTVGVGLGIFEIIKKKIDDFIKKHDTGPQSSIESSNFGLIASFLTGPEAEAAMKADKNKGGLISKLKNISEQLEFNKAGVKKEIYLNMIRKAEGDNLWDNINDKSGAFGHYQFTKTTWEDLKKKHPELHLRGLYNRNQEESELDQRKAILAFTSDIVKTLVRNKIPVTYDSLYTMHFSGETMGRKILKAPSDRRLSTIMPPKTMQRNANRSGAFDPKWTVGDFKKWISGVVKRNLTATSPKKIDNTSKITLNESRGRL